MIREHSLNVNPRPTPSGTGNVPGLYIYTFGVEFAWGWGMPRPPLVFVEGGIDAIIASFSLGETGQLSENV